MKTKLLNALAILGVTLMISACGANQDNLDILNSTNFPQLNTFTSSGAYSAGTQFTTNAPYWVFNTGIYGNYIAPARAIVGEIGASAIIPGSSYVTLIHSARLATRAHGLQVLNVRPGDSVTAASSIGAFITSTQIAFQVIVDGSAVCPLSFVNSTLRASLFSNPCQ